MDHYDVIIIGTGAGGGTLAHRLAPTGKRILLLERGGYLPREPENWDSREVFLKERYLSGEEWIDKDGNAFRPHQQYFVGGNTKFYGAILFRLRERDFHEVRHYAGVSPAWPLTYDDLEPYYTEAERLYLVHGERGEDPTEAPASGPFPYPAVSHEPRIQQLHDDFVKTGQHPFHLPVGVDLDESDPEGGRCVRCDRFDGFPCLTDGKADAHVLCVRPAVKRENVTLRTHARVDAPGDRLQRTLGHGGRGRPPRARGALQRRRRRRVLRRRQLGRAAAALGVGPPPARAGQLLRRGRPPLHGPHQLGRDRDLPGAEPHAVPEDARGQRLLLGADDFDFPLGHIQMLGKSDKNILRGGAPWFAPGMALDYMAKHAIDFWLTTEDLPHPDNRVTVDRSGQIHLAKVEHNTEPHRRLLAKLKGLLGPLGCHETFIPSWSVLDQRIPLAGVAHQCGTVRFGSDPATSALDVDCKAHDLDNLYVVDASFFPSSSAVNPALTAMANALRVGDHLIDRLGRAPSRPNCKGGGVMRALTKLSTAIGDGPRRRLPRHRRDDGVEHPRGAPAPPRGEHRARPRDGQGARASPSSRTTSPRRASTTSRTGATGPAGASCAACSARRPGAARARRRPTARRSGAARRSRCPPSTSPRRSSSGASRRSRSTSCTTPSTPWPRVWPTRRSRPADATGTPSDRCPGAGRGRRAAAPRAWRGRPGVRRPRAAS